MSSAGWANSHCAAGARRCMYATARTARARKGHTRPQTDARLRRECRTREQAQMRRTTRVVEVARGRTTLRNTV
eukprot:6195864-Pleurochrysis_carterae.AAC.1